MTNDRREFTLRGYMDIIRRGKWLILIVAVVAAAAAYGLSKSQTPSYSATSTITVNDPAQALAYTGTVYATGLTPLQNAEIAAPQVTRPEVVRAVESRLGPSATNGSVTASVDPNSYAIHVTATSHSATEAAAIANAFVQEDIRLSTAEVRAYYRQQAQAVASTTHHVSPTSSRGVTDAATLARYQSLAVTANPLSVATPATTPSSPSSPKTTRNTVGALLIGLLLGIAVATARDALDRRLRHSRDVANVLDRPVIGRIRGAALGHTGAPSEGSNGFHPLEDADQESFRILRQNIAYFGTAEDSRTVLVTSAVAEEGKSTVSACLAVAMAEAGKRTLLVECDLRKPVLAKRLGIKEGPGLSDYLTGHAQPNHILQPIPGIVERLNGSGAAVTGGHHGSASLVCITAGRHVPRPAELLASERFREFLREVSGVYDTVILDTPPLLPVADTLAIVPDVSTVVMCVRLERTTRDQARAAQSALERLPERPTGIVVTDIRRQDEGYEYSSSYSALARA
jgi:Mrp family chromosome partitioning ATPase/capsular polysaccharide biosynthesis protein